MYLLKWNLTNSCVCFKDCSVRWCNIWRGSHDCVLSANSDALSMEVFLIWRWDCSMFCGFGAKAQVIPQVWSRGCFIPLQILMEWLLCVRHYFKCRGCRYVTKIDKNSNSDGFCSLWCWWKQSFSMSPGDTSSGAWWPYLWVNSSGFICLSELWTKSRRKHWQSME